MIQAWNFSIALLSGVCAAIITPEFFSNLAEQGFEGRYREWLNKKQLYAHYACFLIGIRSHWPCRDRLTGQLLCFLSNCHICSGEWTSWGGWVSTTQWNESFIRVFLESLDPICLSPCKAVHLHLIPISNDSISSLKTHLFRESLPILLLLLLHLINAAFGLAAPPAWKVKGTCRNSMRLPPCGEITAWPVTQGLDNLSYLSDAVLHTRRSLQWRPRSRYFLADFRATTRVHGHLVHRERTSISKLN